MRRVRIFLKRWFRRVLHQEGKPESIAAGVAIGVFVSMTPTIGLQMVIGVAIATVVRVNKIAAATMAWISNPITIPPIFYFNYWIGTLVLGGQTGPSVRGRFEALGAAAWEFQWAGLDEMRASARSVMRALQGLGAEIIPPLLLGCVLAGTILGLAAYPVTLRLVIAVREQRARRSARLRQQSLVRSGGGAVSLEDMPIVVAEESSVLPAMTPEGTPPDAEARALPDRSADDGHRSTGGAGPATPPKTPHGHRPGPASTEGTG